MIEILFSLNQFSLGLWCLQFVNQFIHPYTFCFLPFFFIYCKSFDERVHEHSLSLLQLQENPEDAFEGNLLLQCQWHWHPIPKYVFFFFLWFTFLCWTMRSFSSCQMQLSPSELHAHSVSHAPPAWWGLTLDKTSQEGRVRSSSWEQGLWSPSEMMSKSMYYRLYQYITQIDYLFTSASKRIITNPFLSGFLFKSMHIILTVKFSKKLEHHSALKLQ